MFSLGFNMVSAVANAVAGGLGRTSRYFAQLDAVQQSHYVYANTLVFSGDFTINFEFSCVVQPNFIVAGYSLSFSNHIIVQPNSVEVRVDGTRLKFTVSMQDGLLHSCSVHRLGGVTTLIADGISIPEDAATTNSGTLTIDSLGMESGTSFSNGILANVAFTDKSDPNPDNWISTSNTLGLATGNVEYPAENVFGGNVVTNGGFIGDSSLGWSLEAPWTVTGEKLVKPSTGSANANTVPYQDVTTGTSYVIEFDVTDYSGSTAVVFLRGASAPSITGNGMYSAVVEAGASTSHGLRIGGGSFVGAIDNVSVRSITNAITYVNIPDAQREQYTLIDGSWLGQELITQAVWESPNITGTEWAFATNQWTLTGTGAYSELKLLSTAEQPDIMRLEGVVTNLLGNLAVAGSNPALDLTSNGSYLRDVNNATDNTQVFKRGGGVVNATLDKPSIKRKIEIA